MRRDEIRHIAVLVAGTDEEYQCSVLTGIKEAVKEHNFNVSVFASFGGVLDNSEYDKGEYNIYSLANYKRFDGAVLLTNTIGDVEVRKRICDAVKRSGIPAAVLDGEDPEFYNIRIDNSAAMRQIVEHVIDKHGARIINYISGPLENPEANDRFHTFLDVMAEHSLPVEHGRVFFGGFRPIDGKMAAEEMLRSKLKMPDAVICANDAMALECASVLMANGVRVPEDVIITGFDYTYYAQHHCPSLSTVARPLSEAGKMACEVLLSVLNGETREKVISLEAYPVYQESCGCACTDITDIRKYKISTYDMIKRAREGASLLNRVTTSLAGTESPKDSIRTIAQYLNELHCEQFCICLCDNWQSAFHENGTDNPENYQINGYTRSMSAPLIWTRGNFGEVEHFRSEKMYPMMPESGGNVSYFFPLHFREHCLGYFILSNTDFPTQNLLCHSLLMNISNSFENIRKLLHLNNAIRELDRLYVIDPLCGIYNRNGFIRLADKMFKRCILEQEPIMISFIDMDGLKIINDSYGHDEGDFALRRLAAVISDCCRGDQICARFGGDEFIVIGTSLSESDVEVFEANFNKHIAETNSIINKPYELGASIGTFVTKVTKDMKLFSLISQADQIMYEQKKRKRTSRYLRKD